MGWSDFLTFWEGFQSFAPSYKSLPECVMRLGHASRLQGFPHKNPKLL